MKLISKIAIKMFPQRYAEWKRERNEKHDAMCKMLAVNNIMRAQGCSVERINNDMRLAVKRYDAGKYKNVSLVLPM